MKKLSAISLLRAIQKELVELRKMAPEATEKALLDKKIKKAKAIAYLVSIALQVLETSQVQEDIEGLKEEIERLKK